MQVLGVRAARRIGAKPPGVGRARADHVVLGLKAQDLERRAVGAKHTALTVVSDPRARETDKSCHRRRVVSVVHFWQSEKLVINFCELALAAYAAIAHSPGPG